jgi:hypothetical protein
VVSRRSPGKKKLSRVLPLFAALCTLDGEGEDEFAFTLMQDLFDVMGNFQGTQER